MDPLIQTTYARSFKGKLYARAGSRNVPLRLSRDSDKFSWGLAPGHDWLLAGGVQASLTLTFSYRSHSENRLHYAISIPGPAKTSAGPPSPKRLGISVNGYLGFYWHADVTEDWKIEPLEMTDEGLICHLRDHQGHRVAAIRDDPHRSGQAMYQLNVNEGEVLTFLLQQEN
ncbi:hypothetical protein P0Y43_12110 [Pseudomonas entomophila]|uniref:hypothetical protein n=1 Tax=Pseudomonas entomophila TaxID=312306 RepID=UPI0023D8B1C2|nr:hypothetical protein [Pseudomonas entomophila]MDF0731468.1 hypothetical protein [Pseudomonas entomophila]